MKTSDKSVKERLLNIVIIVLAAAIVVTLVLVINETKPDRYQYTVSASSIITDLNYGQYSSAVESVCRNRGLGVTEESDADYTECYAAVDYYVAKSYYEAYSLTGDDDTAAGYQQEMTEAYEKMGDLTFLAEDMDATLERQG